MEEPESPAKISVADSMEIKPEEDDYEDIPEEEYLQLVKDMELKKEQDEAAQVEGRENFDYTVPKRRKKANPSQTALENSPPKLVKKDTISPDLLEWVKEQIERSINMFDSSKHWTGGLEQEVKRLCLLDEFGLKLFIWISEDQVFFDS